MGSNKIEARQKRRLRIRKRLMGTGERPRLSVFRSNSHIYAQLVNDLEGTTIAAASTLSPELAGLRRKGGAVAAAAEVGKLIATKAQAAGVRQVVFDRGGRMYHGRVKALAERAREGGLEF